MCVCYRPLSRTVCPNHEVVEFQPLTVIATDLGSVANAYTYSIHPTPPVPIVFYIFFPLSPPGPIFYLSPRFHPSTLLISILSLTSPLPPHLTRALSDRPPGWCPHLPVSTAHLRFPPITDVPRSSSRKPVTSFPHQVPPPLSSSTCDEVPSKSPFLHMPSFIILTPQPPPPLPSSAGGPVPCRSRVVGIVFFCFPFHCASASPSLCSALALGIFWSLILSGVSFCAKAIGLGASSPWIFLAQSLAQVLLWHDVAVQYNWLTSPCTCPSPLVIMIPSPRGLNQWVVALEVWCMHAWICHVRGFLAC